MIRFLEGLAAPSRTKGGDNRSVMPLDVRGCTRATLKASACAFAVPCLKRPGNPLNRLRAWDRDLQLSPLNEEFPVGASHQLASITSLPFVHTARRYYRLSGLVSSIRPVELLMGFVVRKLIELDHLEEVKVVTRFS